MQALYKQQIQLPNKTHSYLTWSNRLNEYFSNEDMEKKEKNYWNDLVTKGSVYLPADSFIEERKVQDSNVFQIQLSKNHTVDILTSMHKAYGTEINDILLCALGMALKKWTGVEKIIISMEGHGREEIIKDVNISRTVGWFTSIYPVLLDMEYTDDLSYQIKYLKEELRRIPNKGVGYGILNYKHNKDRISKSFGINPSVSFNYLGQFDTDVNTSLFQESPYSSGQTVSPNSERLHAIDIVGSVEKEVMTFSITYNMPEFRRDTIEKFGSNFKESLLSLIQHCLGKETRELTPSDVGGEDLSIEDFETITSFYKEL